MIAILALAASVSGCYNVATGERIIPDTPCLTGSPFPGKPKLVKIGTSSMLIVHGGSAKDYIIINNNSADWQHGPKIYCIVGRMAAVNDPATLELMPGQFFVAGKDGGYQFSKDLNCVANRPDSSMTILAR